MGERKMTDLHCEKCGKYMATLRDAKVRDGMVVYCKECGQMIKMVMGKPKHPQHEMPEFLKNIFGG